MSEVIQMVAKNDKPKAMKIEEVLNNFLRTDSPDCYKKTLNTLFVAFFEHHEQLPELKERQTIAFHYSQINELFDNLELVETNLNLV